MTMSKKPKQQVKYNPDWSEVKRADKVKYAISGNSAKWGNLVFLLIPLLFLVITVIASVFETKDFVSDSDVVLFCYNIFLLLVFLFVFNAVMPPTKSENQAQSQKDGCFSVYKLYTHLPVKKIAVAKMSFRYFIFGAAISLVTCVFINFMAVINSDYDSLKSTVGLISVFISVFLVTEHIYFFRQYCMKTKKSRFLRIEMVVLYIFWVASNFGILNDFYSLECFRILGGYVGIAVALAAFVTIIVVQKAYFEKKIKEGSWNDD